MNSNQTLAGSRLNRVQIVSRKIRIFMQCGIPMIVILLLVVIVFARVDVKHLLQAFREPHSAEGAGQAVATISADQLQTVRFWMFKFMALDFVMFVFWYFTILKLFRYFEKGFLFSLETVRCIKILGLIYLIKFALVIVRFYCMGGKMLRDLSVLNNLTAGLTIIFIAWLIDEARKIREEQELTI